MADSLVVLGMAAADSWFWHAATLDLKTLAAAGPSPSWKSRPSTTVARISRNKPE